MANITRLVNPPVQPLAQQVKSKVQNPVSFKGKDETDKLDTSNEKAKDTPKGRKFSIKNAYRYFAKGLISPITTMFESAENFLMGTGIIAIGSVIGRLNKNIPPLFVAAGLALGTLQASLGIKQAITEKKAENKEAAFYNIGAGTGVVMASAYAAKSVAETAGFNVKDKNMFQSALECIKLNNLKKSSVELVKTISDPNMIANMIKIATGKISADAIAGEVIVDKTGSTQSLLTNLSKYGNGKYKLTSAGIAIDQFKDNDDEN
ncbi:MAG: hypothetical protein ACD_20C00016G0007 [uncultured bacterium]|nr:MAG: hypothetical protein ACD_20C00016G0007 [uncultured bacterium]HBH17374.1 hypothetical protein [Cyanobacteria bacterium UBA9579]